MVLSELNFGATFANDTSISASTDSGLKFEAGPAAGADNVVVAEAAASPGMLVAPCRPRRGEEGRWAERRVAATRRAAAGSPSSSRWLVVPDGVPDGVLGVSAVSGSGPNGANTLAGGANGFTTDERAVVRRRRLGVGDSATSDSATLTPLRCSRDASGGAADTSDAV